MAQSYDAVIIGGGHNGLVSAAYLARAGLRTLVLEKRELLGGAAVTEEIFPGFRFSVASYVVSLLRPEIIRELELPKHGLDILPLDGTFTPLEKDYLWRVNDHGRTIRELRRWSLADAEAYEEYGQLMVEMARFIKPILSIVPPDLTGMDPRQLAPLSGLLRAFQKLPEKQQAVFVQLMTMSATAFLRQWFETDPLIATMSASGIIGTYQGVQSPGTAYVLLHHYMGEIDGAFRAWGIPRGGTGGVSNAIGESARAFGAEIRLEAPVARIIVKGGRAVGVALEDGEEIHARAVLSSVDSRLTYLGLIESGTLDPEFEEEVRRFKFRGSSGKVNMAVDRLPDELAVSVVTIAELRVGVLAAADSATRARRLATLTSAMAFDPLPIDDAVAEAWAGLRLQLRDRGRRMPVNDSWIAATAIALGVPVVTQDADYVELEGLDVIRL